MIEGHSIANELNNNTTISNIAPGGVWFGLPGIAETQNYIAIANIVSDSAEGFLRRARLDFRFVSGNEQATPKDIGDMVETVNNEIIGDKCNKIFDFEGFKVDSVAEGNGRGPDYDSQNRIVFQKDYFFYYK